MLKDELKFRESTWFQFMILIFIILVFKRPCIIANVGEIVNLLDNSPEEVQLGESSISFSLSFHDVFENNTNLFKGNLNHVTLICDCIDVNNRDVKAMKIKGLKDKYKPDSDGKLTGRI